MKTRLIFILKNTLLSNQKIAFNINTKTMHMPSILAMDWQVARQLDVVMQVGFTESKDVRFVLQHKCLMICEISLQTRQRDLNLELSGFLFRLGVGHVA